jgi:hypothetical protein
VFPSKSDALVEVEEVVVEAVAVHYCAAEEALKVEKAANSCVKAAETENLGCKAH